MSTPPIDISAFPTSKQVDYGPEEMALLKPLAKEARRYAEGFRWAPPILEVTLAFGVGPILGLFLVRFTHEILGGELEGETEVWVVVGDLPSMCFETENAPTAALALRLYCAIAQDWADNVLAKRDLTESYPIPVEPTEEHARMLKSRIELIRRELIPLA